MTWIERDPVDVTEMVQAITEPLIEWHASKFQTDCPPGCSSPGYVLVAYTTVELVYCLSVVAWLDGQTASDSDEPNAWTVVSECLAFEITARLEGATTDER